MLYTVSLSLFFLAVLFGFFQCRCFTIYWGDLFVCLYFIRKSSAGLHCTLGSSSGSIYFFC